MLFTCWCYYRNNAQAKKDFIPVNVVLAVSFQVQYRVHFLHYSDLVAESGWWAEFSSPQKPTEIDCDPLAVWHNYAVAGHSEGIQR